MDRSKSRYEVMVECAERGDINGVFNPPGFMAMEDSDSMRAMREGLDKLAQEDPEKLIALLHSRMLSFTGGLLIRAQRHVERSLAAHERSRPNDLNLPQDIEEVWLPRIQRLHAELRDITRSMGTSRHTLALARSGSLKSQAQNVVPISSAKKKAAKKNG